MTYHKTKAGINWTGDLRFGAAKILIGHDAVMRGCPDTTGKGNGLFTDRRGSELVQLVGDRMPEVLDCIRRDYDGKNTIEYLLSHRASHCLRRDQYKHGKDELIRFQRKDFSSTWSAVVDSDETLSIMRLQEIQEQHILLNAPEGPGLYYRWNYDDPRLIYVGTTDDQGNRNSGHKNSPLFLWGVRATATREQADAIEDGCHNFLREVGESVRKGTRGLFKVHSGNAREQLIKFLEKYYSGFFFNTGGCKT
jgi:hypothetical protein